METEINKWLSFVQEAWHSLVDDFERFGEPTGYGHMREEDVRSYLFCKICDTLREQGEWLLNLHTEQRFTTKRVDIVVGLAEDDTWVIGVEVKRIGQRKPLREDLDKLRTFVKDEKIKAGILAAIVRHWDDWETLFRAWGLVEELKFEPEDKGNNNYWEIRELRPVQLENEIIKFDSLFFVLRKP